MENQNTVQIVKIDDSQLKQLKNAYHQDYDFGFMMLFILIGLFLGYVAIKGALSPWK